MIIVSVLGILCDVLLCVYEYIRNAKLHHARMAFDSMCEILHCHGCIYKWCDSIPRVNLLDFLSHVIVKQCMDFVEVF